MPERGRADHLPARAGTASSEADARGARAEHDASCGTRPPTARSILVVALFLARTGTARLTLFGDAGTLAAFGFLLAYFMITVAAPFYLRKLGELRARNVLVPVAAVRLPAGAAVGSFYPAPPYPVNLFPYIFLGFMLLGGARLYQLYRAQPDALPGIQRDLERALEASAHDIAVSEEEHQHHHVHVPGASLSARACGRAHNGRRSRHRVGLGDAADQVTSLAPSGET